MTEPLVTVITPAFNVGKYIGESIESVSAQTFRDFEYLVVDDGSADNTAEVADHQSSRDSRIRLIRAEHRGHSAARNRGLQEARGKYIAFLDGDDVWHPRFLERQVALIESLPATVGVVFCQTRMVLENGKFAFIQWQRSGAYDFDRFLIKNNPSRNGSSLLVRKSCFDEVGGFDEDLPSASDLDMWLRIADHSTTPVLWASRHYLVDWRRRPGSVSTDRLARDLALLKLLEYHTTRLKHSPAALAYLRPALAAFKFGSDEDIAEELAARAREAGTLRLSRSVLGIRVMIWQALSRPARQRARQARFQLFASAGKLDALVRRG